MRGYYLKIDGEIIHLTRATTLEEAKSHVLPADHQNIVEYDGHTTQRSTGSLEDCGAAHPSAPGPSISEGQKAARPQRPSDDVLSAFRRFSTNAKRR